MGVQGGGRQARGSPPATLPFPSGGRRPTKRRRKVSGCGGRPAPREEVQRGGMLLYCCWKKTSGLCQDVQPPCATRGIEATMG